MAAAAVFLLYEGRDQTFWADEWLFFGQYYAGHDPGTLLRPDGGQLVLGPVLLHKAILNVFGADSFLPFRAAAVLLVLLSAGLFYEAARRRVGNAIALVPTIPLLVFGASWDMLISPLGVVVMMPVCAGLAALLLLERGGARADAAACVLLVVAVASYAAGLAFAAGAAAMIVIVSRGRERWQRAWIFLIPIALYGTWRIWVTHAYPTVASLGRTSLTAVADLPTSIALSIASEVASITGLYRTPGVAQFSFNTGWGKPLAVLLAGLVLLRLRQGLPRTPSFWAFAGALVAYWVSIGLVTGIGGRTPETTRYQYVGALLLLLVLAELVAGTRLSAPWQRVLLVGALLVSVSANLVNLHYGAKYLRVTGQSNQAELAALDLARGRVKPDFLIEPVEPGKLSPTDDMFISAGNYFASATAHGSPAYSLDQLLASPDAARTLADKVLARALEIAPRPAQRLPRMGGGGRLEAVGAPAAATKRSGSCLILTPSASGGSAELTLPPGGFAMRTQRGPVQVSLRRYADSFSIQLPAVPANSVSAIEIPSDSAPRIPWHAKLSSSQRVEACPAGRA